MIYRGYDIKQVEDAKYAAFDGNERLLTFDTQDAAMSWIDAHKYQLDLVRKGRK